MKATLTFNLPDEEVEFKNAVNAGKFYCVIWNVDQELRNQIKHGHIPTNQVELLEKVRKMLHDELESHGIVL